ncbi:hypothetical protein CHARACLAT_027735 [Characodon lateralis]|uniref:Palmitoyltransferase n=1 Tax=Characodon lateralis TaxID=208331 RepID=A0ABU7F7M5_9TELE|nr:hypothetical protein [Characodon lateralis]
MVGLTGFHTYLISLNQTTNEDQDGLGFESRPGIFLLWVYMFSPCMLGFFPWTFPPKKNMTVWSSGYSKLSQGISVCVPFDGLKICPRGTPPFVQ